MTCRHALDMIDAGPFVAHPRAQLEAVRKHVGHCADCAAAMLTSARLMAEIKEMPSPTLTRDLTRGVMARIAAAEAHAPEAAADRLPMRSPEPHSTWVTAVSVVVAIAAIVMVTASASLSGEWWKPSVTGVRVSLFGFPQTGMELLSATLGAILYALGLFALPGDGSSRVR